MESNTKQHFKALKYAAIYNEFCRLFYKGKPVEMIYSVLSKKYFLDKGTIYRIVNKQAGLNSHPDKGDP